MKKQQGFTLMEILIVVALIAIISAVTIVLINPGKSLAESRNAQRSSNISQIISAITQYTSDSGQTLTDFGTIPLCSATPAYIGTGAGNINLSTKLVDKYSPEIPKDPGGSGLTTGTDANTQYTICLTSTTSGRVRIAAPNAENGRTINVTR